MFDLKSMEEFLEAYKIMRIVSGDKCEFIKSDACKTLLYVIEEDVMMIEFFYYIETGNVNVLQTRVALNVIDDVMSWCLIKMQKVKFVKYNDFYKVSGFRLKDLDELMEFFSIISAVKEADCV
ncbi:hypothetical protein D3C76_03400 [compost metagenome]